MPCGTAGICGISSCFQLLSPGMRQVIHALLTRPPLSLRTLPTEIVRVRRSVRLACVKHAASVHPEPGSNSRYKFLSQFRINLWLIHPCLYCFFRIPISRLVRSEIFSSRKSLHSGTLFLRSRIFCQCTSCIFFNRQVTYAQAHLPSRFPCVLRTLAKSFSRKFSGLLSII